MTNGSSESTGTKYGDYRLGLWIRLGFQDIEGPGAILDLGPSSVE